MKQENSILYRQAEGISTAKAYQATAPRTLSEQVVWNKVIENPALGKPLGGLSGDARFSQSMGFMKMEVSHRLPDRTSITIHYQYNSFAGKAYDMKIVTPQPTIQPGPSFIKK